MPEPTTEPVKIVFGILSTYERNGWHHPSITQFFADIPFRTGIAYRVMPLHNFVPAAAGRNVFCRDLRNSDADWLCMIDNDMTMPTNLLDTVQDAPADAGIVVPAFYLWDQTTSNLTLCWGLEGDDGKNKSTARFEPGFYELSKCGTGVIFIRPALLRAMDYPYFTYLYNADQGMAGTEDIQFALKAREKGFKIYGKAGVNVGHYHNVELSTLWKWAEKVNVNKIDTPPTTGVVSSHLDAESSSVPQAAQVSSTGAA